MLLSAKLFTALKFSALNFPVVKTAFTVGIGALAWGATDIAQRPSVGGGGLVAQPQAVTTGKSAQDTQLHDEVQYFSDKF